MAGNLASSNALALIGKDGNSLNLNLNIRCSQSGNLNLGAGRESPGKIFSAYLAGRRCFSQVGDETGYLDHVAQGGSVGLQDGLELLEDHLGLGGDVPGLGGSPPGSTTGDE